LFNYIKKIRNKHYDDNVDHGVVHDEEFYPQRGTAPKKVSAFRKFFNIK